MHRLYRYMRRQLKHGHKPEDVRAAAKSAGWDDAQVDEVLQSADVRHIMLDQKEEQINRRIPHTRMAFVLGILAILLILIAVFVSWGVLSQSPTALVIRIPLPG